MRDDVLANLGRHTTSRAITMMMGAGVEPPPPRLWAKQLAWKFSIARIFADGMMISSREYASIFLLIPLLRLTPPGVLAAEQ